MDLREALEIKKRSHAVLLSLPNVKMVGLGGKVTGGVRTETLSIRVFVERKLKSEEISDAQRVPTEFEGLPTDVEELGEISLLGEAAVPLDETLPDDPLKQMHRPLVAGVKIGVSKREYHIDAQTYTIMAGIAAFEGTLGCFVQTNGSTPRICALTCQHVVNRVYSPGDANPELTAGRDIYQPEAFLGANDRPLSDKDTTDKSCSCKCQSKQENRRLGRVFSAQNNEKIDAALVALKPGVEFQQRAYDLQGIAGPAKGLVPINGSRKSANGDPVFQKDELVYKFGLKTGSTVGKITDIALSGGDIVDAVGQYRVAPTEAFIVQSTDRSDPFFSGPGDSGSVVIGKDDKKVIGLLWGGRTLRDANKKATEVMGLIDPIDLVESRMQCTVLSYDPSDPTKTVGSANLDGVPHIDEAGNPVAASSTNEQAERVLEQLRSRPLGRHLASVAESTAREITGLLHRDARVRAHWVRNGGPYLAGELLYRLQYFESHAPLQIAGLPLKEVIERISSELAEAGSTQLRRTLEIATPILCDQQNKTMLDMVEKLESAVCQLQP